MYVLKKTGKNWGYVAMPGSNKSYTRSIIKARKFPTREAAEIERCIESEIIVPTSEIMEG